MTRHVVECATCDCTVTRDHHTRYPDHSTIAMTLEDAPDDRQAVIAAVLKAAREHGNVISANDLRPLIPASVHHKHIGATVSQLARTGALEPVGWVENQDVAGGNSSKLTRSWLVHPERLAA